VHWCPCKHVLCFDWRRPLTQVSNLDQQNADELTNPRVDDANRSNNSNRWTSLRDDFALEYVPNRFSVSLGDKLDRAIRSDESNVKLTDQIQSTGVVVRDAVEIIVENSILHILKNFTEIDRTIVARTVILEHN
jgi:hypothetical protein